MPDTQTYENKGETLELTKEHFDDTGLYVGAADVTDWKGGITIAEGLGLCRFSGKLKAAKWISAKAGSGIKAGWGIEAGWGIKAGLGIEASEGIKAGWSIEAGEGIEASEGIKAGEGIEAGWGIEAGSGIEASEGIKAGLTVTCKAALSFGFQLFAGTLTWRKRTPEDGLVTCGRKEGDGEIVLGTLVETGIPTSPADPKPNEVFTGGTPAPSRAALVNLLEQQLLASINDAAQHSEGQALLIDFSLVFAHASECARGAAWSLGVEDRQDALEAKGTPE